MLSKWRCCDENHILVMASKLHVEILTRLQLDVALPGTLVDLSVAQDKADTNTQLLNW